MHKLIILFRRPEEPEPFETRWSQEFVPVAEQMEGVRRISVSRVYGGPAGESDLHLAHEFYFDDADSMRRALASPQGQAAGKALMSIAPDFVSLHFAEHQEEER